MRKSTGFTATITRTEPVRPIFVSMVDLSDNGALMDKFLGLPCPKMFMYGAENAHLSYLAHLDANDVKLVEIPASNPWPLYSNPPEMWRHITDFQAKRS